MFEFTLSEFAITIGALLGICYGVLFVRRMQWFIIGAKSRQPLTVSKHPWWFFLSFLATYAVLVTAFWVLFAYIKVSPALTLLGFGLGFFPVVYLLVRKLS